jgi:hypothetical protein
MAWTLALMLVGACSSSSSAPLGLYATGCCNDVSEEEAGNLGVPFCNSNFSPCESGLACEVSMATVETTCMTPCCPPGQCSELFTDVKVCPHGQVCVLGNGGLGYCARYLGPASTEQIDNSSCAGGACQKPDTFGDTNLTCVSFTFPNQGSATAACGYVQQ